MSLRFPAAGTANLPRKGVSRLVFWARALNENVPAWQGPNPVVTLNETEDCAMVLTPNADLLSGRPNNEEREGWSRFDIPLAGDDVWKREGPEITTVNHLTIGFDSWGSPALRIWIDGLSLR